MTPLAILAISAGWYEHEFVHMVTNLLPAFHPHVDHGTNTILMIVTISVSLAGMAFAYFKFQKDGTYFSEKLKHRFCYKLLANQYYFRFMIDKLILQPYLALAKFSWKEIDMKLIDAIVDGIAKGIYSGGEGGTAMQSGNLSKGLKWMGIGILVLIILSIAFGNLK
jgi:NADH-quinone oxidoreductase subunit L